MVNSFIQDDEFFVDPQSFTAAYGESIDSTLNIDSWQTGGDLEGLYQRLEAEVQSAVEFENAQREIIRRDLLKRIRVRPGAPHGAGCYRATSADLKHIHHSLLFNGAVEACDGTSVVHDTLPITITQIGVCLVSYQGDQGSWSQRLFRRDLRASTGNALDDLTAFLDNRSRRGSTDVDERGKLSQLARRGIMAYAERAILTWKSQAPWRLGHGSPMPYELLTGSGSMELLQRGMDLMEELMLQHRKVIFVPSAPSDRHWLTLGQALNPLEFVILETIEERMLRIVNQGHFRSYEGMVRNFCKKVGPQFVMGIYRTASAAPPYLFFQPCRSCL